MKNKNGTERIDYHLRKRFYEEGHVSSSEIEDDEKNNPAILDTADKMRRAKENLQQQRLLRADEAERRYNSVHNKSFSIGDFPEFFGTEKGILTTEFDLRIKRADNDAVALRLRENQNLIEKLSKDLKTKRRIRPDKDSPFITSDAIFTAYNTTTKGPPDPMLRFPTLPESSGTSVSSYQSSSQAKTSTGMMAMTSGSATTTTKLASVRGPSLLSLTKNEVTIRVMNGTQVDQRLLTPEERHRVRAWNDPAILKSIPPPLSEERGQEKERRLTRLFNTIRLDQQLREIMDRPGAEDPRKLLEWIKENPELVELVRKQPHLVFSPMKKAAIKNTRSYKAMQYQKERKKKKHTPRAARMRELRNKWREKRLPTTERKRLGAGYTPLSRSSRPLRHLDAPTKKKPFLPTLPRGAQPVLSKRYASKKNAAQIKRQLIANSPIKPQGWVDKKKFKRRR